MTFEELKKEFEQKEAEGLVIKGLTFERYLYNRTVGYKEMVKDLADCYSQIADLNQRIKDLNHENNVLLRLINP